MKIKFLSIIASFFMVSLVITSCLGDDEDIEYSPDATIRAFELDTIGKGIKYKFTIDQLKGEIYNEDSLPVRADTIIDRILIKVMTTASGIVTMKDKLDQDSIINIADSIDLRKYINAPKENKPLELKVYAPDMLSSKTYKLSIRKHHHDPDSLKWQYTGIMNNDITEAQRSITFNGKILTYTKVGGTLKVFQSLIDNINWTSADVLLANNPATVNPTSIIVFDEKVYATFENSPNSYTSNDGITWTISSLPNVELFLAAINKKISYIKKEGNKHIFTTSGNGEIEDDLKYEIHKESMNDEIRKEFPNIVTSYTNHENRNGAGSEGAMLMGKSEKSTTINDGKSDIPIAVAWGYAEEEKDVNKLDENGNEIIKDERPVKERITISRWVSLPAGSIKFSCPELNNPTIIYYNAQFYLFGEGFDAFYVSASGRDWQKTNKKFSFPNQDWSKPTTPSTEKLEFRGRQKFSVIQDTNKDYIYLLFGKEDNITFTDAQAIEHSYSHNSEVWRGRLNSLWFLRDPLNK